MKNTMRMPASFNLVSDNEMVYVSGGFNVADGAALFVSAVSALNFAWGMPKLRKWAYENANDDRRVMITEGAQALFDEMSKGFFHALTYGYTALNLATWWPVTLTCLIVN